LTGGPAPDDRLSRIEAKLDAILWLLQGEEGEDDAVVVTTLDGASTRIQGAPEGGSLG
jgi:hypothetical protein